MLALLLATIPSASASTLNIPPSAFTFDPTAYSCNRDSGDRLQLDGGDCYAAAPLLLPAGTVVSSVRVYYYDNSASCSMRWYFYRETSSGSGGSIDNGSSSASSASTQSDSLTGTTLSSSYWYSVRVEMDYTSSDSCRLVGVKVTY